MKQVVLLLVMALAFGQVTGQKKNALLAGAAQGAVTPPMGAFIAGDKQNRTFAGVHDDIYAKAVVISNGKEHIALLTIDCIGLLYPQLLQIRDAVKQSLPGFPVEHIVMSSTHTHSGPDVVGIWGPDLAHSGVDTNYMKTLVQTAAAQVVAAWNKRVPVTAYYATATHGEEWVHNISQPAETDRSVTILQLVDGQQQNVATLTNFACHPTFLDGVNDKVSSDYVAGYYEQLNTAQGGVNMFLQGAIGGWVQPEHEPRTFEAAYRRGKGLAFVVSEALGTRKKLEGNAIRFTSTTVNLPLANQGFRQLSQIGVIHRDFGDSVATEIAYFTIGNAAFATHPGETVPAMSHATKALMKNTGPRFVMGLSMDALGYILKPDFFDPAKAKMCIRDRCSMSVGVETMGYVMKTLEQLIR